MELQWPLIIFTTLIAWSAGLFATMCILALKKEGFKAQMTAWIVAAVLLVVGGIAVFFHLQHWERIFNGFGHITSGITQELIFIVLMAVAAIIFLVFLRKAEDETIPAWVSIVGIVVAVALVGVMAHSYMMASRPAWNSVVWICALIGNACVLGPVTMAIILASKDAEAAKASVGLLALVGAAVNAVTSAAYLFVAKNAVGSLHSIQYYIDPTEPTNALLDVNAYSAFATGSMSMSVLTLAAVILALVCAFAGKKQGKWTVWGTAALVCAVVGAITLRVVFYQVGANVFMFY